MKSRRAASLLTAVIISVSRLRGRHLFALDVAGVAAGTYAALSLLYQGLTGPQLIPLYVTTIVVIGGVRAATNIKLGLYSRSWRSASIPDFERVAGAVVLGSLVTVPVVLGVLAASLTAPIHHLPWTFWVAELLLSVTLIGGLRFAVRAASDRKVVESPDVVAARRATLLYGAGHAGVLVARWCKRKPTGLQPVGFLDDDPSLTGKLVANLRVYGGLASMEQAVTETRAQTLLITMPSAPGSVIRRVVELAIALGLEVRTVPSINDLLDGSVDSYRIRRVRVEDLLRRPIVAEHVPAVDRIIPDRVVMITGGGGSIGSELARQVYALRPRRLVLVDRAEGPLYLVERELENLRSQGRGDGALGIHIANVASRSAMERVMCAEAPSVIFHAAAYKHVPMMEKHPSDAAYVNIGGTLVLLDAADAAGVERFVFVSTDKAVRPSSVMGASKRIAELLVADAARRTGSPYVTVRFGNVLGSSGSVVPIFQAQLENGEPLTITHPEMTRYFMTIPEAAWLILDAAAIGRTGDLFALDMGEPVRIMDLARDLVRLSGRDPDSQPIQISGLRPGEKLHEQLFYGDEQIEPTKNPKVIRAVTDPPPTDIRERVREILEMATGDDERRLREVMLQLASAPRPTGSSERHPDAHRQLVAVGD